MNLDKTQIIMIIVVIIFGIGAGIGVQALTTSNFTYTVVNQTNSSTHDTNNTQNSTHDNQTTSSSTSEFISASQALSIAKSAYPVSGATYTISSYPTSESPYYSISVVNSNYDGPGGFVEINAYTGEVVATGT